MKYIIGKCPVHCLNNHGFNKQHAVWGGLSFGQSPVIHSSYVLAQQEARRLADTNPGTAFVICSALSFVYIPMHTMQEGEFE